MKRIPWKYVSSSLAPRSLLLPQALKTGLVHWGGALRADMPETDRGHHTLDKVGVGAPWRRAFSRKTGLGG